MDWRAFNPETDREAVHRIWHEVGWLEPGKEDFLDRILEHAPALVACLDGQPECMVIRSHGDVRHLDQTLRFGCVNAVTTSRIARKQGFASKLTAATVAALRREGALVSGLGMFEQGYYNRVGFGSGAYMHRLAFDPAHLTVPAATRVPRRLTTDDWEMVHASRVARLRGHGGVCFDSPVTTREQMLWNGGKRFGLGFCDGPNGELTHHVWIGTDNVARGPYEVSWITYQTGEQYRELLGVLKTLGDQVRVVKLTEPASVQLQDFIRQPFTEYEARKSGQFPLGLEAVAWWQMRMNDVAGCLAQTRLPWGELRFNLALTDPITRHLPEEEPWRGETGEWVVTLGTECAAEPGRAPNLPTLTASLNAFTRLWLGVRPASGLAISDELTGPPELLGALDEVLRLPSPQTGWQF